MSSALQFIAMSFALGLLLASVGRAKAWLYGLFSATGSVEMQIPFWVLVLMCSGVSALGLIWAMVSKAII